MPVTESSGDESHETPPDTSNDELREALARTTAAMEREALDEPAVEAEDAVEAAVEPPIDRWPWETAPAPAADSATEPEVAEVLEAEVEEPLIASALLDDLEPIPTTTEAEAAEPEPEVSVAEPAGEAAPDVSEPAAADAVPAPVLPSEPPAEPVEHGQLRVRRLRVRRDVSEQGPAPAQGLRLVPVEVAVA